jgi:hypothetical protein
VNVVKEASVVSRVRQVHRARRDHRVHLGSKEYCLRDNLRAYPENRKRLENKEYFATLGIFRIESK